MVAGDPPATFFNHHFMKRSDKPTKYLLIRAGTYSDWDSCDFAVLEITLEGFLNYEKWLLQISRVERDYWFAFVAYYDPRITFYRNSATLNAEDVLGGEDAVFINVRSRSLDDLATPESNLSGNKIKIYSEHAACFSAYGKHTNEEFYTAEFDVAKLIENARPLFQTILNFMP